MDGFIKQVINSMSPVEKGKAKVVFDFILKLTAQRLLNEISHVEFMKQLEEISRMLNNERA